MIGVQPARCQKKGEGWIPSVQTAAKTPDYHILMAAIGCRRKVVLYCSGQISSKQQRLGGASRLSLHERKASFCSKEEVPQKISHS